VLDTHTASIAWGDGATSPATVVETAGTGKASAAHTYAAPGLYPVTITVTDDDGATASAVHEFVVVYDASGGFATGGGWFQSPSGAYTPGDHSDADLTGRAHFAFVSKYAKGATVPSGTTSFRFTAADLDFQSTSYDWMVVSGTRATYRGSGTLNGAAGYRFVLAANDGDGRSGGVDQLRVRIWNDATGVLVYDNQAGAALDAGPVTAIGGGQIAVHK
jgi:PKD repeat protein